MSPGLARALVLWRLNLDVPRRPPSEFRRRFHTCTNFDYHQHYLTAIEGGLVPPRISISGSDPATGGQLPPGISFMIGPRSSEAGALILPLNLISQSAAASPMVCARSCHSSSEPRQPG